MDPIPDNPHIDSVEQTTIGGGQSLAEVLSSKIERHDGDSLRLLFSGLLHQLRSDELPPEYGFEDFDDEFLFSIRYLEGSGRRLYIANRIRVFDKDGVASDNEEVDVIGVVGSVNSSGDLKELHNFEFHAFGHGTGDYMELVNQYPEACRDIIDLVLGIEDDLEVFAMEYLIAKAFTEALVYTPHPLQRLTQLISYVPESLRIGNPDLYYYIAEHIFKSISPDSYIFGDEGHGIYFQIEVIKGRKPCFLIHIINENYNNLAIIVIHEMQDGNLPIYEFKGFIDINEILLNGNNLNVPQKQIRFLMKLAGIQSRNRRKLTKQDLLDALQKLKIRVVGQEPGIVTN